MKKEIVELINNDKILNLNLTGRIKFDGEYTLKTSPCQNAVLYQADYWHIAYANSEESAKNILQNIKPEKEIGFAGVGESYYHMAKHIYPIKWDEFCHLYYLNEADLDLSLITHRVDSLKISEAAIVNEYYTYKDEDSLEYIESCIKNRPTSVIRDENGKPISWAVIREDGSLGIMYTLKEHRSKGYAVSVSVDLAKKAFDLGIIPYVHIVKGNTPSVNLAKSIGFKYHCDVVWFGI